MIELEQWRRDHSPDHSLVIESGTGDYEQKDVNRKVGHGHVGWTRTFRLDISVGAYIVFSVLTKMVIAIAKAFVLPYNVNL